MAKATSGGGITGNKNVSVGVRSGPASTQKISPSGASEIGSAIFQNPSPLVKGTMSQVPLGNAVGPSTVCGPGGSRTVRGPGTQGQH